MIVVLDTNIFVSGVFFGGLPGRILSAWATEAFELVVSPAILDEYAATGRRLSAGDPERRNAYRATLELVIAHALLAADAPLAEPVCDDRDDDKFLAAALVSGASTVVSGDHALQRASGWAGIAVLSPREFVERFLV